MSMLREFREFAVKGNVMDMAIGIIIGGAFTPIVKSMVDDILMPPIGMLLGGVDFSDYKLILKNAAVAINYGNFMTILITFVIIAFAVFMLVKVMNRLRRQEEVAAVAPTDKKCLQCFMTIPIEAKKCGHCTSAV
jgi:large conductance mechanosensitive channel